jgi:hypothetical protein
MEDCMNTIYKVLWNAGLQMFQVVSELAKGKTKSKRCRSQVLTHYLPALTFSSLFLFSTNSFAADSDPVTKAELSSAKKDLERNIDSARIRFVSINHTHADLGNGNNSYNDSAKGTDSIAVGKLASTKEGADASVAIGVAATTEKPLGIAIGVASKSKSEQGIALGGWAEASGELNAIAIGTQAKAMNSGSQAIGQLSKAQGHLSQAYGDRAEAYDVNGVAIGSSSRVSGDNSVTLGAYSYVGEKNSVPPADSATPRFHTYQDKEYSIIHPTNKKKHNYGIALGALSKVFGSQGIAVGGEAHDHVSLAVGSSAVAQGYFSASIGAFAITKERDAISLGHVAQANKRGSVSLGHDAISNVESAVALGENSLADRSLDDLKSIGYDPLNKRVEMDSDGSNKEFVFDTDADKTRYTQLSQELIELKKEANNLETEFASIVNEKNKANLSSEEERDIEQRLNQKSAELDSKLSEIKLKEHEKNKLVSVWRATAGAVSVGDHDIGITRQITNLAAGSEDTDAVNVAQLKALATLPVSIYNGGGMINNVFKLGTAIDGFALNNLSFSFGDGLKVEKKDVDGKPVLFVGLDREKIQNDATLKGEKGEQGLKGEQGERGPKGEKGKSAYESWKALPANHGKSEAEFAEVLGGGASKVELQQLRTEHDSLKAQIRKDQQSIQQLDRNMQKMNKDLRAGIAGATAIAFLQGGNFAGDSAVSVAVGTYKGEHALAVGYGRRLTNNKIEIKLGASVNSQSDVNAGGSVGYHW